MGGSFWRERRACLAVALPRVSGYRGSPRRRAGRPLIRSTRTLRIRQTCGLDISTGTTISPLPAAASLAQHDFHELSRAGGPSTTALPRAQERAGGPQPAAAGRPRIGDRGRGLPPPGRGPLAPPSPPAGADPSRSKSCSSTKIDGSSSVEAGSKVSMSAFRAIVIVTGSAPYEGLAPIATNDMTNVSAPSTLSQRSVRTRAETMERQSPMTYSLLFERPSI